MIAKASAARFARPYARAAFDYAKEHQQLKQWSEMLRELSELVQQPTVAEILNDPHYSKETRAEVVLTLAEKTLDEAGKNFVKTLATYQRLWVLPEVAVLFETLRAEIEKTLPVKVKSAIALTEAYATKLNVQLAKKLGRPVELKNEVDASLLGGFIIYAGDRVIDSSIRGQLEKLRDAVVA